MSNQAMETCLDITGKIQAKLPFTRVVSEFEKDEVIFEGEEQPNEVAVLMMNHTNNTRLRSNNEHTPRELSAYEPHFLSKTSPVQSEFAHKLKDKRRTKVGGNEPCPGGSGTKHNKCCMK